MQDAILTARIEALDRNLQPPSAPYEWRRLFRDAHVGVAIWDELARLMTLERRRQSAELERVRRDLSRANSAAKLRKVWEDYGTVYEASQSIFQESREILGGLAFREKNVKDAQLCRIAEEIVLDCNRMAGTAPSLPLPGHEALSRTLARIVRMRLPEWTIWTLPLVAHEYGRVVIDQLPGLVDVKDRELERFAATCSADWKAELGAEPGRTAVLQRAGPILESLIANAFAAYTMGPAYGYAAITLALNPALANTGHPPHSWRAEVILAVLERMREDDGKKPFADTAAHLKREWHELLRRVRGRTSTTTPPLVDAIADAVMGEHPLMELRYRTRAVETTEILGRGGTHGWRTAEAWADTWVREVHDKKPPSPPAVERASRVHDVLNAAWLARVALSRGSSSTPAASTLAPEDEGETEAVRAIEDVALSLCALVLQKHAPPEKPDGDGPEPAAPLR